MLPFLAKLSEFMQHGCLFPSFAVLCWRKLAPFLHVKSLKIGRAISLPKSCARMEKTPLSHETNTGEMKRLVCC